MSLKKNLKRLPIYHVVIAVDFVRINLPTASAKPMPAILFPSFSC